MHLVIGPWDLLLIAVVSVHATILAYLPQPRWKAFMISLPIPFTVATLALGRSISAINVLALVLLFGFTQGVRILHVRLRVPIVPAILCAALAYCLGGALLARIVRDTDVSFWAAAAAVLVLGVVLRIRLPHRDEPDYRTPLPIWVKLPIIAGVVIVLVALKSLLLGAMTAFPMVGVIAAYEARHSLWTQGRQIPVVMATLVPLMATSRLVEPYIGLGPSLAAGWLVFLTIFLPFTYATLGKMLAGEPSAARV